MAFRGKKAWMGERKVTTAPRRKLNRAKTCADGKGKNANRGRFSYEEVGGFNVQAETHAGVKVRSTKTVREGERVKKPK